MYTSRDELNRILFRAESVSRREYGGRAYTYDSSRYDDLGLKVVRLTGFGLVTAIGSAMAAACTMFY